MIQKAPLADGGHIDFEVHGDSGPFLFLGSQLYVTSMLPGGNELKPQYVDRLKNDYRVIVADWPRGTGASSPALSESCTKENAIADIHAIADAAGAETFAWWGYSFGAAVGLQLCRNNPRISAFVCGGFPPLAQPLSDMLYVVRKMAIPGAVVLPEGMELTEGMKQMGQQSIRFYESVAGNDDRQNVAEITCPRMVLHDVKDVIELGGITHDLSMRTRAEEDTLKQMGWDVAWIETGQDHYAMLDAKAMGEAFKPLLDKHLLT